LRIIKKNISIILQIYIGHKIANKKGKTYLGSQLDKSSIAII